MERSLYTFHNVFNNISGQAQPDDQLEERSKLSCPLELNNSKNTLINGIDEDSEGPKDHSIAGTLLR